MRLTERQAQIVERVAKQVPYKRIAHELQISVRTVEAHVQHAAARIPGNESARRKITLFFFGIEG